jgi:hypothetical protein
MKMVCPDHHQGQQVVEQQVGQLTFAINVKLVISSTGCLGVNLPLLLISAFLLSASN